MYKIISELTEFWISPKASYCILREALVLTVEYLQIFYAEEEII